MSRVASPAHSLTLEAIRDTLGAARCDRQSNTTPFDSLRAHPIAAPAALAA